MLAAGALLAQQVAARATRDALFLSNHDVARLPAAMAAAAMLSLAGVAASSRWMSRFGPARVVPSALALSAGLLLGEWGLSFVSVPAAAVALYLHVALFGATLVSGFWLLLGELYDPHSAKGALGPVAAGANAGAVAGGVVAWCAGRWLGLPATIPVIALLTLACWAGVRRVGGLPVPAAERDPGPSGMAVLRENRYLRAVAAVVALGAFVEALLDYVLGAQAVSRFAAGPRLMTFFSAFHTGVAVVAAALLAMAGEPALRRLGIAGTVSLRPLAAGLGALLAWASPSLVTAVTARAAEALTRNSLFRTGYELLYMPLAARERRPVKAILDVGVDRLGTVAGSVAVLAILAATGASAPRALPALAAAAAAVTVMIALRLQSGYVTSLADSLRSGAAKVEDEAMDAATLFSGVESRIGFDRRSLLREIEEHRKAAAGPAALPPADPLLAAATDLRSGDPVRVRRALAAGLEPALVGFAVPLLARDDVGRDAQRALRQAAPRVTGQLVDALHDITAHSATVRRRLATVIGAAGSQRAADGLVDALHDPAPDVRARCGRVLESLRASAPALVLARDALLAAASRELVLPDPDGRGLRQVFALLGLVGDGEAMRIAYHAVHSTAPGARGTALEYLENVVAEPVRSALLRRLGANPPGTQARPRADARDELLKTAIHLKLPDEKAEEG